MKIRLLAEARGAYRTEFLTELLKCGQEIEVTLHFGDKNSDFDAPSLMRQERKRGQRGHLFDKIINDRKIIELIQNNDFEKSLTRFIDHLNRASERYVGRSHSMYQLHEYVDYYNILVSSIADKIIAEKITHVLFFDIPHLAVDTAIYDVAKLLELDVLILCQLYPSRVFSCSRIEDFGKFDFSKTNYTRELTLPNNNDLWYMDPKWQKKTESGKVNAKMILKFYWYLIRHKPKLLFDISVQQKILRNLSKTVSRLPYWRTNLDRFFNFDHLNYLVELTNTEEKTCDLSVPYIYFPLHLQPEMTTSTLGGRFRDQLLVLENLSAKLPNGWRILVKENPKQGSFARSPLFFFRFKRLNNVSLVKSDMNSLDLIKNSKIVATITGTAAIEAAEVGKPAIIFGHHWFRNISGIFEYDESIDLEEISNQKWNLDHTKRQKEVLLSAAHRIDIDKGFFSQVEKFDAKANAEKVGKQVYELLTGIDKSTFNG